MSESELSGSEIYLQENIVFEKQKKYLIKANSGHGKSSILNFIYGSNINFDGIIDHNGLSNDPCLLKKQEISYVFQDFKLFPNLSLLENITLKNTLTNYKTTQQVEKLITQVGLIEKKDQMVAKLSLGQKQRVAIVRALCQPFKYLLLDEPFSHLDKQNIEILTNIIDNELEEQQAGLILTSLDDEYLFKYDEILKL